MFDDDRHKNMLQWFDHKDGTFYRDHFYKIDRLVVTGRLIQRGEFYECLPTPGYNKRTYLLSQNSPNVWVCNCQGFRKRNVCSHLIALMIVLKQKRFDGDRQGILI